MRHLFSILGLVFFAATSWGQTSSVLGLGTSKVTFCNGEEIEYKYLKEVYSEKSFSIHTFEVLKSDTRFEKYPTETLYVHVYEGHPAREEGKILVAVKKPNSGNPWMSTLYMTKFYIFYRPGEIGSVYDGEGKGNSRIKNWTSESDFRDSIIQLYYLRTRSATESAVCLENLGIKKF